MECGRLNNGLRWSAYSSASSDTNMPPVVMEDLCGDEQCPVTNNYLITFPEEDSESESARDIKKRISEEIVILNEAPKLLNRCYENPLFIPACEVLKDEISDDGDTEELMKSEAKKFEDYKFCEAVNDFDIELEAGEAVPIVYLSTSRAARLQRALRLGGYKKVGALLISPLFLMETFLTLCSLCQTLLESKFRTAN
ncbi:hypothetical protein HF086_005537 [Spodoptera exigua]|uniref:Uncharacterized protein n=1 Tax=Spodoptera exigua TaxID=7107 RepID=A0A922MSX5_SPOEX|nr:hypothetical protein HF086_005537 [Spodoptera exigua]